jgi:Zn-dependent metalloprotease
VSRTHRRASAAAAAGARLEQLRAALGDELDVHMNPKTGTPRLLSGRPLGRATTAAPGRTRAEKTARAFLHAHKELLRLSDPDVEMQLAREESDWLGHTHLRFAQRHRGLRVWPAELLVHLDPTGDVSVVNGTWVPTPDEVAPSPALEEGDAVARALEHMGAGDPAIVPPAELLVWAPGDRASRLAWSVLVPASVARQWRVVVDALDGSVLDAWNTAMDADVAGSGTDLFGATHPIRVWSEGTNFLVDTSKPMFDTVGGDDPPDPGTTTGAIIILDATNQPPSDDPQSIPPVSQITSAAASEPAATWVPDGVSALVNFSRVYDYFLGTHGRDSLDGQGGSILAIVRLGQDFENAFFLSEQNLMAFGDAQAYAGALDVVGHELTHGVTFHTANLVYRGESGALNESMSDIFGELVDAQVRGSADWLVGSPPAFAQPLRNMQNPSSISTSFGPYPDHYSEFIGTTADNGGVHLNSSIPNHAFYQLAQGLPGAIGLDQAGQIFFRALTVYLTANSRFVDARIACIQAAGDLFGAGSPQAQGTAQAFDAVGITGGTGTPPPSPFPGNQGADSTIFVYFSIGDGAYFLGRRETALGDPAGGIPLSAFPVAYQRPAATGDGTVAWFIDGPIPPFYPGNDLCLIETNAGLNAEETCLGFPGSVHSIAVSPDGSRYGFVMLDGGVPESRITVFDFNKPPGSEATTYDLRAPATVPGPGGSGLTVASILAADVVDFTADGRSMIYDALNQLQYSGGTIDVWSIYEVDLASGDTFIVAPPVPGFDIGYPALAQRSDSHLVFEVVDVASNLSTIFAANRVTGDLAPVGQNPGGLAVPGYDGGDARVVFSVEDVGTVTGFSLLARPVGADRITPTGAETQWLEDAYFGVIYRRGTYVPEPGSVAAGAAALVALAGIARRRRPRRQ